MKIEKAIAYIKPLCTATHYSCSNMEDNKEHLVLAIKALEKQSLKKVIMDFDNEWICPICGASVGYKYCSICGQALKWEEKQNED